MKYRIGVIGSENVVEKKTSAQNLNDGAVVFYLLSNKTILHIDHETI